MKTIRSLPVEKLGARLAPERIPYADSNAIPSNGRRHSAQKRALEAIRLSLHIQAQGFNIFLAGEPDLGRSFLLRDILSPHAKKEPTPPDLAYVFNFEDQDKPLLVRLPAGVGIKLKQALSLAFTRIQKEVARRLDGAPHTRRRSSLMGRFHHQRETLFKQMSRLADSQGFNLGMDEGGGMTLYPLVGGKRLSEQEFDGLEDGLRTELRLKGDSLMEPMSGFLRKLAKVERDFQDQERGLERELVEEVLKTTLDPLVEKYAALCDDKNLKLYFTNLRTDTLSQLDMLLPQEPQPLPNQRQTPTPYPLESQGPDELGARYTINLFVDNSATSGAPVVFEDHPTLSTLTGCIEREAELGALITDFSLIKAGSIHRANGGYLVIHMDDIAQYPQAWEAMLRALRSGFSRMEDASDEGGGKTKGLHPEPVPLSLKVVLIGREDTYDTLLYADQRFAKLFKIKAHLTEYMPRNSAGVRVYLSHIRRIIDDDKLLPFDREALAGLVDFGSRIIEDQQKLSLKYPCIRELMVESSALAAMQGKDMVTSDLLRQAREARLFRSNLVEEAFMEEYDKGIIKVRTSGEAVGKVNGLALSMYGDFEFGLPHQISCTVGAGFGGIIDLERDAQLGGPIHTKAMMILKSYLVGVFAHNKPLVLTGSLGFEQNYVGIEGDSASGAELAALLSALSGVPIRLNLAFTGAVGQSGQIMAVGGVTPKVEGFFEVCKRHGLTGDQGVILPRDNIGHLLLRSDVLQAVADGRFHIYAVEHITEAMEILTGMPSGRLRRDGAYSKGSLYRLADERLRELTNISVKQTRMR